MRIQADAWQCGSCGHVWLAGSEVAPKQCAKCRRRDWNSGEGFVIVAKPKAVIAEPEELQRESVPEGRTERGAKVAKMSAAEYFRLSKSDQARAMREGKF